MKYPNDQLSRVLFIPHGGGPLPLLGDQGHQELVDFLQNIAPHLGQPSAIIVISAHWEESIASITSGKTPPLIYDYYGFPDEAYHIEYPALPALRRGFSSCCSKAASRRGWTAIAVSITACSCR